MMKGKYVITSILVLAVLCAAPVAVQALSLGDFAITTLEGRLGMGEIDEVLASNTWKDYRLADWNDIDTFAGGDAINAHLFSDFVRTGTGYKSDVLNQKDALDLEVWVSMVPDGTLVPQRTWYDEDTDDQGDVIGTRHYFARVPGAEKHPVGSGFDKHDDPIVWNNSDDESKQIVLGSWNQHERHALLIKNPVPTPEPATLLLLGAGLMGLAGFARKKITKK